MYSPYTLKRHRKLEAVKDLFEYEFQFIAGNYYPRTEYHSYCEVSRKMYEGKLIPDKIEG